MNLFNGFILAKNFNWKKVNQSSQMVANEEKSAFLTQSFIFNLTWHSMIKLNSVKKKLGLLIHFFASTNKYINSNKVFLVFLIFL